VLPDDLPDTIRNAGAMSGDDTVGKGSGKEEALLTLDEVQKRHLMRVLRETGGNKARAAKILGIDRRTLYRMAERFGLEMGEEGESV
jgi:transcriptional regulator of acetoin/glycerol metabolism